MKKGKVEKVGFKCISCGATYEPGPDDPASRATYWFHKENTRHPESFDKDGMFRTSCRHCDGFKDDRPFGHPPDAPVSRILEALWEVHQGVKAALARAERKASDKGRP